jgi:hypothetical protein
MRLFLSIVILLIVSENVSAQSIGKQVSDYFVSIRSGQQPNTPESFQKADNASAILDAVKEFYRDSLVNVRLKAYTLTFNAGVNAANKSIRQKTIGQLIGNGKDVNVGNVRAIFSYLSQFRKDDFSAEDRKNLQSLFYAKPESMDQLIRLIGFLQIGELSDNIRFFTYADSNDLLRWSALLSLARTGDRAAIREVANRAGKVRLTDDVIHQLYPDLIYTRQRIVMEQLLATLNSDEKNCNSANPNSDTKIPCAYRVMEMLVPAVEGYPLKLDESGDIDTQNYNEALQTVRAWFKANTNYKLRTDTY